MITDGRKLRHSFQNQTDRSRANILGENLERYFLPHKEWLCMASFAIRLACLANRLLLLQNFSQEQALDQLNTAIREAVRVKEGRNAKASAMIIDSQSAKSAKRRENRF